MYIHPYIYICIVFKLKVCCGTYTMCRTWSRSSSPPFPGFTWKDQSKMAKDYEWVKSVSGDTGCYLECSAISFLGEGLCKACLWFKIFKTEDSWSNIRQNKRLFFPGNILAQLVEHALFCSWNEYSQYQLVGPMDFGGFSPWTEGFPWETCPPELVGGIEKLSLKMWILDLILWPDMKENHGEPLWILDLLDWKISNLLAVWKIECWRKIAVFFQPCQQTTLLVLEAERSSVVPVSKLSGDWKQRIKLFWLKLKISTSGMLRNQCSIKQNFLRSTSGCSMVDCCILMPSNLGSRKL